MQMPLSSNQIFWTRQFSTMWDTSRDIFCPVCYFFFSIFDELWSLLDHDKFSTMFNTLQVFFFFFFFLNFSALFVTLLFCLFPHWMYRPRFFFYRLTSSSMCHQLVFKCCRFCYDWMKVLVSQKKKKEIKLLLGTNSLMSSYTQMVVEIWSRFDRGLTELV